MNFKRGGQVIIFIDGYNVLKLVHGPTVTEAQRTAYATLLGKYSKRRGHKVVLVFDAGPSRYPLQERHHGITILYSGEFQSADDCIVKQIHQLGIKEIVIVTADRGLLERVKGDHIHAIEPLVFHKKVQDVCSSLESLEKKSIAQHEIIKFSDEEDDPELDLIMYQAAGMVSSKKDDQLDYVYTDHVKKQDQSKKHKKRMALLKKL